VFLILLPIGLGDLVQVLGLYIKKQLEARRDFSVCLGSWLGRRLLGMHVPDNIWDPMLHPLGKE
jgi:hypothetical protein